MDWGASRIAVVRSAWDYYRQPGRWLSWITTVSTASILQNPSEVLHWNTDKRYLLDLVARGIDCIPTEFVHPGSWGSRPLRSIVERRGWTDLIVKPAVAASAHGVRRFAGDAIACEGEAYLQTLLSRTPRPFPALVQPYLASIETVRERSLVFIAGSYTHAFTKPAFSTDATGGTVVEPHQPSVEELDLAARALAAAPARSLYARVDIIPDALRPLLAELELIEPDLALRLSSEATEHLADALFALLHSRRCITRN
jgi:hypothetical protein